MAKGHQSTSGARIYVMGPNNAGELDRVFHQIASLLYERDFDVGIGGLKCKLGDGRARPGTKM
jgi:hypothetical protein